MKPKCTRMVLILSAFTLAGSAFCESDVYINSAIETNKGDTVRGPATIHVGGINPVRNVTTIGNAVTFPNGPSLDGLPFIPALPAAKGGSASIALAGGGSGTSKIALAPAKTDTLQLVTAAREELDRLIGVADSLNAGINSMAKSLNDALADVKAAADALDAGLRTGGSFGPDDVHLATLTAPNSALARTQTALDTASRQAAWPGDQIAGLQRSIATLTSFLLEIPGKASDWDKPEGVNVKPAYTDALKQTNDLQTATTALADSKNATYTAFQAATQQARGYNQLLAAIRDAGPSAFRLVKQVTCGFAFDKTKDTALQITTTDRLTAGSKPQTQDLTTVECTSPLSVSAGFGFSSLAERNIAFIPTGTTDSASKTVNNFGYQNSSSFRPIPLLLLNARIWESSSDLWSVHISGGAGVDLKTAQVGTDIDFVVGPSLAFRRTLFLTPGVNIGRSSSLAADSGFKIGGMVPTGLAAPPIEKKWDKGFVFAITWKIR